MRDIIFRGKTIKDSVMVYGNLIRLKDGYFIHHAQGVDQVHEETVGEFTGMLDANKQKIFEHDVIKATSKQGYDEGVIVRKGAEFSARIKMKEICYLPLSEQLCKAIVIARIDGDGK